MKAPFFLGDIPQDMYIQPLSDKFDEGHVVKATWLREYLLGRFSLNVPPTRLNTLNLLLQLDADYSDLADRSRGALLGLAVGDALGMPLEFMARDRKTVTGLEAGGPFDLKQGCWTDDTSMACCLAYSLIKQKGFDPAHQILSYCHWYKQGAYSPTGKCFDIGATTRKALEKFLLDGVAYAGSTDPRTAGNGSLMRLAPVPIFYADSFEDAVQHAGLSSRTTHQAVEAIDSCRYYSALIHGALNRVHKDKLLDGLYSPIEGYWESNPLCAGVRKVAEGSYKSKSRDEIKSTGYVIDSMEAALWAFYNTSDFKSGALAAVNLAGDSDTIGAIYGQLGGAFYGETQIPIDWLLKLQGLPGFYHFAEDLTNKKSKNS